MLVSALLLALGGCAHRGSATAQPNDASARTPHPVPTASATRAPAPSNGVAAWRYEVRLQTSGDLTVEAAFDATDQDFFGVDESAARFVSNVELARGTAFVPLAAAGSGFRIDCRAGCRVRYRFALRAAAEALNDIDTAIASGDAFMAPPSTWLLSPPSARPGALLEFHVDAGQNAHFASGFERAPSGKPDTYVAPASQLDDSSYAAFGALQVAEVPAGDTTVRLAAAPKNLSLSPEQVVSWLATSAGAVANYYEGHLPARHALVVITKGSGNNTRGETLGGGGPAVFVRASDLVNPATTRDDWVVTHELLHVNFPDLGRAHAWLSEGLATYLEPVARARVGLVSDQKFWGDLVEGLPQGLPQAGDEGLENTHTWGRTYWGGALYCLLADVTIRERSSNAHSLDDVIRWIGKTGEVDDVHWSIQQFLDSGQKATGLPVLSELYAQLAEKPGTVNLSALFARLGVHSSARGQNGRNEPVTFDDAAPLAKLRHAITAH